MKILMLVNWKLVMTDYRSESVQPPDYFKPGENYWFFRYFKEQPQVDVVDITSFKWIENFEKNRLRFYVWQTLKVLPCLKNYDLVISHGMQSGILLSLYRRIFGIKVKHIVFDIGSFSSASESGITLKLMQIASKSIDGLIYHTSSQINYYKDFFPWLVDKSYFVRFGTDLEFYKKSVEKVYVKEKYIICIGYIKRDWDTLVSAFRKLDTEVKLRLVGHVEEKYNNVVGIEQIPYVPINILKEQISGAIAGVLPLESYNYSLGQMTLMQQMAFEKCVITADVPSVRDYIEDMKTAILYKPQSVDDLANKIDMIVKDSELRERIGKNAREWLDNICNEQIMAQEIEKVISIVSKEIE